MRTNFIGAKLLRSLLDRAIVISTERLMAKVIRRLLDDYEEINRKQVGSLDDVSETSTRIEIIERAVHIAFRYIAAWKEAMYEEEQERQRPKEGRNEVPKVIRASSTEQASKDELYELAA